MWKKKENQIEFNISIFFLMVSAKNYIFFTTFRMTVNYVEFWQEWFGWQQRRQPNHSLKTKQLNVISNEVRDIHFL